MSDQAQAHAPAAHEEHADAAAHEKHYKKIWLLLVVLLAISFLGPMLEIRTVTLVTAFGIAVYKAWLVAKHFMHVTAQPRYVVYMLSTVLVFMLLFYAGTAPDVEQHEGKNWTKVNPDAGQPERVRNAGAGERH
jgi:caa(3)-type oxidase subunit IV